MDFAFFFVDWLGKPVWMWLGFLSIVVSLLALDLGVLHRDNREIGVRESLILSSMYIALGLAFGGWIWWQLGGEQGMNYLTGFVVEKTLALDNVFVIALIFSFFAVPRKYQHRVLFWGVLGVIVLRAIMIGLGATLISNFSWVLYLFAAFLVITGIKMLLIGDKEPEIGNNPIVGFMRRRFNVTEEHHGQDFFVEAPSHDRQTGLVHDAAVHGARHGRNRRRDLRGRLRPCDLCDHDRSVHRLHVECVRDPWSARTVFRTRRDDPSLSISEAGARSRADLHRLENLHR